MFMVDAPNPDARKELAVPVETLILDTSSILITNDDALRVEILPILVVSVEPVKEETPNELIIPFVPDRVTTLSVFVEIEDAVREDS
jgi:hypothetical protein